jgi:hypothetical protein
LRLKCNLKIEKSQLAKTEINMQKQILFLNKKKCRNFKNPWVASQEALVLGLELDHLSLTFCSSGLRKKLSVPLVHRVVSNVVLETLTIDLKGPTLSTPDINCTKGVYLHHLKRAGPS